MRKLQQARIEGARREAGGFGTVLAVSMLEDEIINLQGMQTRARDEKDRKIKQPNAELENIHAWDYRWCKIFNCGLQAKYIRRDILSFDYLYEIQLSH